MPHFCYPLISWWASRLFPFPGIVERTAVNTDEQVSLDEHTEFSACAPHRCMAGSYGRSIFSS